MGLRAWNWGMRRCAFLRALILNISYYLLFAAVGRTGSSLDLALRDAEISRWIPRTRHHPAFGDCDRLTAPQRWWGHELLVSARRAGNGWQVFLLPLVLLLLVLEEEGPESVLPSSTYTLY